MPLCIVGAQWGDEGKGKVVHYLSAKCDVVARYGGGDNAGHTVVIKEQQFKLHLIPSGIFYPEVKCILGCGMVINPKVLLNELKALEQSNISTANLWISDGAHVIMPYHCLMDNMEEDRRGDSRLGTTVRGIGPAYQDKVARQGIRMIDLTNAGALRTKIEHNLKTKAAILNLDVDGQLDYLVDEYSTYGKILSERMIDTSLQINKLITSNKRIIFEGAQGTLLDIDFGTYPFVTASHPIAGGAAVGLGVPPYHVDSVLGVLKAYTTRVGNGVFPTELCSEEGENLRQKGDEYGTTTGRPRRCGWLDMVMLRYSMRINGYTELAITKLDVLSNIDPLKICTAYKIGDKIVNDISPYHHDLEHCQPIYEELPGWKEDISKARSYDQLPAAARRYVERISELLGVSLVSLISVGASSDATICVK